ncbi:ATP-binding protein, partial [Staphylococcus simulans]
MELLSGILISSYQGLMLFIISKVILNFKYTPKEKMTIGFITIISGLIYIVLNRFTLFIIILIDTIYLYRKTKLYSILTMVGSVLIIYLGNLSAISSFLILDQEKTNIIIVYAVYLFLFTVTSLILAY